MADAGFFKGTSAEQDSRFANKQKKLLKQMKFPDNIDVKIDILKINLDVLKPWITKRLQELLGIEDDVVIEFVFNQLEDKNPDPKMMQINLTGFLGGSKARLFIGELWNLLASAQSSPDGIPAELVEMKKKELLKRQEEDDRLREIRKREEDSHRQDIKPDINKSDNKINGRNLMSSSSSKSRNENGNIVGYKSRSYHDDDRRDRDRRRSPQKTRPEPKSRHTDKKPTRSVSKSSESENDRHQRQEKTEKSSNRHDRHRLPSKSPSHSRSPIKSSRKNEKPQQRPPSSSSTASNISHPPTIEKPKARSLSNSSVDRSHKKSDKPSRKKTTDLSKDQIKEKPVLKTKKNKKQSKRTRSSSALRSSSNSSISRSSSSERESKKKKKLQSTKSASSSRSQSPSPIRNKKKDKHKSKKHHRSNDNKRKSHRDYPDKSKTKKIHRNKSSKNDNEIPKTLSSSSPKKPRLESQIKVQTPPPSSSSEIQQQELPIKPNRTERIVVLEESRTDSIGSISTRVSITTKTIYNEEQSKTNNTSEDENEIDLRERLLREKAIKSMKRRQLTTNDRIVYETQ